MSSILYFVPPNIVTETRHEISEKSFFAPEEGLEGPSNSSAHRAHRVAGEFRYFLADFTRIYNGPAYG